MSQIPPTVSGRGGVFLEGAPAGCRCSPACEFPCAQRVGLTSQKCCGKCVPLPPVDDEEEA